jgi:hypothetical protein
LLSGHLHFFCVVIIWLFSKHEGIISGEVLTNQKGWWHGFKYFTTFKGIFLPKSIEASVFFHSQSTVLNMDKFREILEKLLFILLFSIYCNLMGPLLALMHLLLSLRIISCNIFFHNPHPQLDLGWFCAACPYFRLPHIYPKWLLILHFEESWRVYGLSLIALFCLKKH